MSNPLIDIALVCLMRQRSEQEVIVRHMSAQIDRDGSSLRLMDDDRTLGEHLADAEQALARANAAIEYLESLP